MTASGPVPRPVSDRFWPKVDTSAGLFAILALVCAALWWAS